LVVEDSLEVRESIVAALMDVSELDVTGQATDVTGALNALAGDPPDVMVLDVNLSGGNGLDVLEAARRRREPPAVIVFAASDCPSQRRRCLDAGADMYLAKQEPIEELVEAVRLVGMQRELEAWRRRALDENVRAEQMRALADAAGASLWLELDTSVVHATAACESRFARPLDQLIGRSALELIHPDDVAKFLRLVDGANGAPQLASLRLRNGVGGPVPVIVASDRTHAVWGVALHFPLGHTS
jgi:DNA-binding NarL/FixJ family response regulator